MPSCYSTNRHLPFLNGFSTRDRNTAEKAFSEHEARKRKAAESRGRRADKIVEDMRGQLHNLLGARKFAQLHDGLQRERLAFRDLFQPPQGLNRDYAKHKKASKAKVDALLRKLGVSRERVRRIGRESDDKLRKILSAGRGKVVPGYNLKNNLKEWLELSPLHKFALPWGVVPVPDDPKDPYQWFLFTPPFFGFLFSFEPQATGGFVSDRELILQPSAGVVGQAVTMDITDTDDIDVASGTAETQIAFGFVPPVEGRIQVLIDATSIWCTHDIRIHDKFGFSDAWCYQTNYLMMNVLHPNVPTESLAQMSNAGATTDGDDVIEHIENLTSPQHYYALMTSSGSVPAGQTVVITAGTREFDIAYENDMELHSKSEFIWIINSVEVRVVP
jgi:hypothetical protein